jgi:uncharacterized SAM-binding protein YcdF (DUF218 family)
LIDLLKLYLRPSSTLTMLLVFAVGVVWLWWRPASRKPRWYLLAALLFYWIASTPLGARPIAAVVGAGFGSLASRADASGADAVVVLGGGAKTYSVDGEIGGVLTPSSMLRALEAARVAKLIGARLVVVSGGAYQPAIQLRPESAMLRAAIVQAGVPNAIVVEDVTSRTTREQAQQVKTILDARRVTRFVLVTSPMHMRRALLVFRATGMAPVPSAAPIRSSHLAASPWLLPDDGSLTVFDESLYDIAALTYYWARGWMKPAPAAHP